MVLLISLVGTLVLLLSLTPGLFLPTSLPVLLRTLIVALIAVTALSPLFAIAFDISLRICLRQEITSDSFLQAVRQYGGTAIRLGLIHLGVAALTALNVTFYLHLPGLAGRAIVLLCLYLLLFWGMMALYQGPLLVLQETGAFDEPDRQAKRGAMAVIRRSFFLVIGEPLFSIGLLLAVVFWSAAALLTAVGAAMLWPGGACLLITAPTLALLAKYGVIVPVAYDDAPPLKEA
ncbi:MAG: hypothetical protein JWL77_5433 [Chthonomonadaceae bacterium]|nr:hypothetical protein [Chthonomonadaceae bacterium]